MEPIQSKYLVASLLYAGLGIFILVAAFVIIEKIAPQNLWREIVEKQNTALAVLATGFMIAVAMIISSAIHG